VAAKTQLPEIVAANEQTILDAWITGLRVDTRISAGELRAQCRDFLAAVIEGLNAGAGANIDDSGYGRARMILADVSRSRAVQGFSPRDTATFVFTLKEPLFGLIRETHAGDAEQLAADTWLISTVLDGLGLYTTEIYQKAREEVIIRQQQEIAELSTPVVKLWDGIVALPLIGTLDSARTQVVMENLLQTVVETEAEIAIIDITGVPTVDTLVAQHLLKTVAAARLMGADCIISGIRPQIAQTMVHLGVELNVVSKATLRDAFALALDRVGRTVVKVPGVKKA
jgi:rsbT co-antagonist protein RsbR